MTKWRPRIGTILLIVNLVVLLLPLGGIAILRIYESALIRQTETELVAQGAFIAASYRSLLKRETPSAFHNSQYGNPISEEWLDGRVWKPRPALLDLADQIILPPIPDAQQTHAADDAAELIGDLLMPVLQDAQLVTLAGIRLVDADGIVVASTGAEMGMSLLNREEISRALTGETVSVMRKRIPDEPKPLLSSISRGTRIRAHVVMPVTIENRVVAAVSLTRTPKNIAQALYGKRVPLTIAAISLLVMVILLTLFTTLTIRRPIQQVVEQARRAIAGQKGAVTPLQHPVTREARELSHAVSNLAATLEQRAEHVRNFANHVSHEFKAPITSILGTVELLKDHANSMSDNDRKRFLNNLQSDATRLDSQIKQLLQLARAGVMPTEESRCDVQSVLQEIRNIFSTTDLQVDVFDSVALEVKIEHATLVSILTSLLQNSSQHGASTASIQVEVNQTDKMTLIRISDNGPGIPEGNAARIFEPFFTTQKQVDHSGLGLALVQTLLQAHHGDVTLEKAMPHAVFRIELPLAS